MHVHVWRGGIPWVQRNLEAPFLQEAGPETPAAELDTGEAEERSLAKPQPWEHCCSRRGRLPPSWTHTMGGRGGRHMTLRPFVTRHNSWLFLGHQCFPNNSKPNRKCSRCGVQLYQISWIHNAAFTWGPVIQGEGSRLAASEQEGHWDTRWCSRSFGATASSGFPAEKTHFELWNWHTVWLSANIFRITEVLCLSREKLCL